MTNHSPYVKSFSERLAAWIFAFPVFIIYLAASVAVVVRVLQWTGVL